MSELFAIIFASVLSWELEMNIHSLHSISQTSLSWSSRERPAGPLMRRHLYLHSAVFKPLENDKERCIGGELDLLESRPVKFS